MLQESGGNGAQSNPARYVARQFFCSTVFREEIALDYRVWANVKRSLKGFSRLISLWKESALMRCWCVADVRVERSAKTLAFIYGVFGRAIVNGRESSEL